MLCPGWSYDGDDPGLRLFTLAHPKLPAVQATPTVFEIGSADTDFLERARRSGAIADGIDWRDTGRSLRGDALTARLPMADVYIGLSSIEHVGLGHYDADPVDHYGDIKIVQRVRDHLYPGGFFYLDVPYAPEGYRVLGTKCRIYDDAALRVRFGPHEVLGYTTPSVDGWIDKPTANCTGLRPYYYVALVIRHG